MDKTGDNLQCTPDSSEKNIFNRTLKGVAETVAEILETQKEFCSCSARGRAAQILTQMIKIVHHYLQYVLNYSFSDRGVQQKRLRRIKHWFVPFDNFLHFLTD